jgi:hypothetical protein
MEPSSTWPRTRKPVRVKNLRKNSKAPLFIDQYSEDWMRHVATMMTGTVDVIEKGSEFEKAKELLEAKYQQYNGLFSIKEGESVILCFKPTKAVAWDYVLGVWPLSIFASAERLSSDEKSSVTNEGDEAAAVLDWVDIQLEARTQTVRRARRDRADKYEKAFC